MKKIVSIVVLTLVVAALAFAAYMGAFASIVIKEQEQGPYTLMYHEMNGNDMGKVGEITVTLNKLLSEHGISRRRPFDVFFPDGRTEIGFAVEGVSHEQLATIREHAKVREIPAQRCMVARFPWRNTLSYIIGYLKVDPALAEHRSSYG